MRFTIVQAGRRNHWAPTAYVGASDPIAHARQTEPAGAKRVGSERLRDSVAGGMERIDIAAEFDRRADHYDDSEAHRWQADQAAALTAPESGWTVLDVATGTGLAARALAARMDNIGEIVGIDIAGRMLDVARRRSPAICRYLQAQADELPFADERFDAVVCVAGLPYLGDPTTVLAEWRRVCGPGGSIVFFVPVDGGEHTAGREGMQRVLFARCRGNYVFTTRTN